MAGTTVPNTSPWPQNACGPHEPRPSFPRLRKGSSPVGTAAVQARTSGSWLTRTEAPFTALRQFALDGTALPATGASRHDAPVHRLAEPPRHRSPTAVALPRAYSKAHSAPGEKGRAADAPPSA
ncbi:hypothetical protein ACQ4WX_00680 [Streptomyces lasalocidi]